MVEYYADNKVKAYDYLNNHNYDKIIKEETLICDEILDIEFYEEY